MKFELDPSTSLRFISFLENHIKIPSSTKYDESFFYPKVINESLFLFFYDEKIISTSNEDVYKIYTGQNTSSFILPSESIFNYHLIGYDYMFIISKLNIKRLIKIYNFRKENNYLGKLLVEIGSSDDTNKDIISFFIYKDEKEAYTVNFDIMVIQKKETIQLPNEIYIEVELVNKVYLMYPEDLQFCYEDKIDYNDLYVTFLFSENEHCWFYHMVKHSFNNKNSSRQSRIMKVKNEDIKTMSFKEGFELTYLDSHEDKLQVTLKYIYIKEKVSHLVSIYESKSKEELFSFEMRVFGYQKSIVFNLLIYDNNDLEKEVILPVESYYLEFKCSDEFKN